MLPKYAGSFTAEVRTVFLYHCLEVSSPFKGILRRSSEGINRELKNHDEIHDDDVY